MKQLTDNYLSLFKKMVPRKVTKPSVGLDVGVSSCRMVEVFNRPEGCVLLNWAIEPIVNGDVVKSIKSVMGQVSQPNLSPTTALTGKGTLIRFVDMPKMSLEDLKRSFSFEVDKYFPFPKDQIFTDCHILDAETKDNKFPVLVAAAKKDLVNERIKLLNAAGLQGDFITLNSVAIANVLDVLGLSAIGVEQAQKDEQVIAILDVGEVVSNLTIFVNGRPKFNRDIFIGGRDYSKAVSSSLKVSIDEAEKIKQNPEARAEEVSAIIESVSTDFVSELRLSFDYFVTETNLSITRILLTGGSAGMNNFAASLAKQLELKVELWNPFSAVKIGEGVLMEQLNPKVGVLGTALGLALYS